MGFGKNFLAIASLGVISAAANAGVITTWEFVVQPTNGPAFVASANPGSWNTGLLPNGDTFVSGEWDNGDWSIDFDLVFNNDPLVTSNFVLTNVSGGTLGFTVSTDQFVANPAAINRRGSISGSVGDNTLLGDTATVGALGNNPLYMATVNGLDDRALFPPLPVTTLPNGTEVIGPASFGIPAYEVGPGIITGLGIRNMFTITADDSIGLNNTHIRVVPTPGALALVGFSGLVIGRRRR
ncbi:MAG TPA: hypothetical protein VG797_06520 [Phycisphaerales bacterium]|nr:hypothetical protein [Phycisphaerales bacterium]